MPKERSREHDGGETVPAYPNLRRRQNGGDKGLWQRYTSVLIVALLIGVPLGTVVGTVLVLNRQPSHAAGRAASERGGGRAGDGHDAASGAALAPVDR